MAPSITVNATLQTPATGNLVLGVWRLADPKVSLASLASMFLGACAAAHGGVDWLWLGATVAGILALEIGKNASGELVDYDSGTDLAVANEDRTPFSGGKRVMVDGLLSRHQTKMLAGTFYMLGIAFGLVIVSMREPAVLWFGLTGVGLAYFYHGAPLRLAYRGFGELAVALSYGPLICCGTYLVQHHEVSRVALVASLPLGLLIAAFLWINEFPDLRADRQAGKNTLVVRLGRHRASLAFVALVTLAFVLLAVAITLSVLPVATALGFVALIALVPAARTLLTHPSSTPKVIPAQAQTLTGFLLYALGVGLGLLPWG